MGRDDDDGGEWETERERDGVWRRCEGMGRRRRNGRLMKEGSVRCGGSMKVCG